MKERKCYQSPTTESVRVNVESHLLAGTEVSGPGADFMKDPTVEESEP